MTDSVLHKITSFFTVKETKYTKIKPFFSN